MVFPFKVSDRQRRRKLSQLKGFTQKALYFAESLGLKPETLLTRSVQTGASVVVNLGDGSSSHGLPSPPDGDSCNVMQVLYLLDRFAVSDEFYHELTQVL